MGFTLVVEMNSNHLLRVFIDFAGINIYLHEFKKQLGTRAQFFVPDDIEALFCRYGNRSLYDRQFSRKPARGDLAEAALENLWDLICRQRKGLEQEVLIAERDADLDQGGEGENG